MHSYNLYWHLPAVAGSRRKREGDDGDDDGGGAESSFEIAFFVNANSKSYSLLIPWVDNRLCHQCDQIGLLSKVIVSNSVLYDGDLLLATPTIANSVGVVIKN